MDSHRVDTDPDFHVDKQCSGSESGSTGSTCFLGLLDPDPDPLVRGMDPDPDPALDPDPSIIKHV